MALLSTQRFRLVRFNIAGRLDIMHDSNRSLWAGDAIIFPELVLIIMAPDQPRKIERIKQSQQEMSLIYHPWSFDFGFAINRQVDLVVGRKIFRRWIDIQQECVC